MNINFGINMERLITLILAGIGDLTTGKYGFIDKKGVIVINPQFDSANAFKDGVASVRIGDHIAGKYGFIGR